MNGIRLTAENGSLFRNAPDIWMAFKIFPDDEDSRRQAVFLAADERARFFRLGPDQWRPSALTQSILHVIGKKTGQITVAGYTAIAFILLLERGVKQPTLYAAAQVVSKALAHYKQHDPIPIKTFHFDGEWDQRSLRVPSGRPDIEKAFKAFRSVAHLIAADLASSEHFKLMHIFNRTAETMAVTVVTAQAIEFVLSQRVPEYFFDYWSVRENRSNETESLLPIYVEGDLRTFLESGFS